MQIGDRAAVHHIAPEGEVEQGVARVQHDEEEQRADDIEQQMDHGRPLGVFAGADGGEKGGDAGADILAHNKRNGDMEGDHAGRADGLQDAHGGGGALNQGGDGGAHQDAQQGVGKGDKQLTEGGELLEAGDGAFHGLHADEQKAQSQHDLAHDLPPAASLEEHEKHDARRCQQGAQDRRLEQGQKDVVG